MGVEKIKVFYRPCEREIEKKTLRQFLGIENFTTIFGGEKIKLFFTDHMKEKIKTFLFSRPFFGRENKGLLMFTTLVLGGGGKKILKILFSFTTVFWGG